MRPWSAVLAILLTPALWAACADDEHREQEVARDGGGTSATDSGATTRRDSGPPRDAGLDAKLDSSASHGADARPSESDAIAPADATSHADVEAPALQDAAPPKDASASGRDAATGAPSAQEVAEIFANRCGSCHQNQGADGFLFDGRLRATLFAAVEAPPTPAGDPPGAAACRKELRVLRGDANSYLIRKMELGLGRQPSPAVCGNGMPADTALDDLERGKLAKELDRLKLWIVAGAPLE